MLPSLFTRQISHREVSHADQWAGHLNDFEISSQMHFLDEIFRKLYIVKHSLCLMFKGRNYLIKILRQPVIDIVSPAKLIVNLLFSFALGQPHLEHKLDRFS
jgi:hypothetical protein